VSGTTAGRPPAAAERAIGFGSPSRSALLLVTALAILLLPLAMRLSAIVAWWQNAGVPVAADVQGGSSPERTAPARIDAPLPAGEVFAAIEPAAGPVPAAPPAKASSLAAARPEAVPGSRIADAPDVAALEEIAAELKRRRTRIEEREQALELREAAVKLVEERIREQLGQLDRMKGKLEALLGQVTADEAARINHLVKVYEAMKAKSAAGIFDSMALDLLLPIVRKMRDTKVAAIIAEMSPDKAQALTTALAEIKQLPEGD
jgi:flagellar motility protein MotE (MotC chaperone)